MQRTLLRGARRRAAGLAAALGILLASPAVSPPALAALPADGPAARLDPASIDRFVEDYRKRTGLPGAVVAVTRGGGTVHAAGYGRTASGEDMTARTPVPIASLSKSMTALAVMRLVDEGRVDLDRPVRHHLPEFAMADPRAEEITVRQLLNQTSGMADSAHPEMTLPHPRTLAGAVAALRGARLADAPGSRWNYHNPNYFVSARLVEVVAGQPFARYMADRVFRPLGMTHTRSVASTDEMPDRARGHVRAYGKVFRASQPRWFAAGGHGVVTTASDLARWLIAQHNRGVSADGRRVVSARGVETTHTPPPGRDYAMGWSRGAPGEGPRQLRHSGELLTHNAVQILLPDSGIGIAVVTNTGMVSGDDSSVIARGLVDLARGENPGAVKPFSMTADPVLAALTLLAVALGVPGVVRARRWAGRAVDRPLWRTVLRSLPYALPVLLLVLLGDLVGLLTNRAADLALLARLWPALVVWSAVTAAVCAVVLVARGAAVFHVRRRGRPGPAA
ncbi:serine hydrolase domain-containing protein [Streptomyces glaucosporus]|uniref:Serine hydrolase domain-containing protein n=1 Tax=Streptomyces glaucosporus TaxID=284044 RepID=A0ABP5VHD9_9ACTN